MIAKMKGILVEKNDTYILLEINNITYEIFCSSQTINKLPKINNEIILHTEFIIRENSQSLYGFLEQSEKELFKILIKVNGLGVKTSINILSSTTFEDFINCIENSNINSLMKFQGIGKKTATKIILELQDKIKSLEKFLPKKGNENNYLYIDLIENESFNALSVLGYKEKDILRVLKSIDKKNYLNTSNIVKLSLKELNK